MITTVPTKSKILLLRVLLLQIEENLTRLTELLDNSQDNAEMIVDLWTEITAGYEKLHITKEKLHEEGVSR